MITSPLKSLLLLLLIISTITITISVYSKLQNVREVNDMTQAAKPRSCEGSNDSNSKRNDFSKSEEGSGGGEKVSLVALRSDDEPIITDSNNSGGSGGSGGSSSSSSPDDSSSPGGSSKNLYNIIDKVFEDDEDLEILVTLGMKKELDEYFKLKQFSKYNLSREMEKAVIKELKRLCKEIASSDKKTRKYMKKEYKNTVEDKKKQFKEEYEKEPENRTSLKGKRLKFREDLNEIKLYER
jgi:hypothetical protein